RLAGHGGDDITRALRVAVRHVLDKTDDADGIGLRLASSQRVHGANNGGCATHVALHVFHAAGRLDRDAARVEHNTLADEGDRLLLRLAVQPLHDYQTRRTDGALRYAEQRTHAETLHFALGKDLDLDAKLL